MGDVLVAYPHSESPTNNFTQSLLQLANYDRGRHIATIEHVRVPTGDLPGARNSTMRYFLENGYEWLFMVDDDMGFQETALESLRAVADPVSRPIVGALCFGQRDLKRDGRNGYRFDVCPTIYSWEQYPDGIRRFRVGTHFAVNSLVRCDSTGAACVLIHRSVGAEIFNRYGDVWFEPIEHPEGWVSEDLSFFYRWMEIAGPGGVTINTAVKTNHSKTIWLDERDFWERVGVPPARERVDVIVPVLHRPQNVAPFMETLRASTGLATAWFVCDRDDRGEQVEVLAHGGRVLKCDGTFAEKVNYAYGKVENPAPWIFIVGDDVLFQPAWLDHALYVAGEYRGQVIGTNDLGNQRVLSGDHATHLLISREYVDRVGASWDGPGVVCHEYGHCFVDDEIVTAAKLRGVWQMALGSVVEHMHPFWNKGLPDPVYDKGFSHFEADREEFRKRLTEFAGAVAA